MEMNARSQLAVAVATLFLLAFFPYVSLSASPPYQCLDAIVMVYNDGSIEANITLNVTGAPETITIPLNFTPLAAVALYESGVGAAVDVGMNNVTVYAVENGTLTVTIVSLDATSKQGAIWTLTLDFPCTTTIILPPGAAPVSVSPLSFRVVNVNGSLHLTFEQGPVRVEYVIPPAETPTSPGGGAETTATTTTTTSHTGKTTTEAVTGTSQETRGGTTAAGGTEARSPAAGKSPLTYILIAAVAVAAAVYMAVKRPSNSSGKSGASSLAEARLDERDRRILEALKTGPKTASELMAETGIPKTPLYRRLKKLIEEGVVEVIEEDGARKYKLKS